jgi:hypothetical protein
VQSSFTAAVDGDGNTVVTISFDGSFTRGADSVLVDGNYQLTIAPEKVRRAGTQLQLDGDGDGQAGGVYEFGEQEADDFFALFADVNGDRQVNFIDFLQMRAAFNSAEGDGNYNPLFDFDHNGNVNFIDFLQFRNRFGTNLPFE